MKIITAAAAALITCLTVSSPAEATLPNAVYIKKAIFIRIHYDATFYNFWRGRTMDVDVMVKDWFNAVRDIYKNTPSMHNIDLYLLDDFTRANSPMMSYDDPNSHLTAGVRRGEIGGDVRLVNYMRDHLATGPVTRTNAGRTYRVGRTVNWVFVHRGEGGEQGEGTGIGSLATADASLFVTTAINDVTALNGQYFALDPNPLPDSEIFDVLVHETGHIIGGKHELSEGCPTRSPFFGGEVMCGKAVRRERRFGTANYNAVQNVIKPGLARCNNAFSGQADCERQVDNECARILDYTQIAACQAQLKLTYCSDLCNNTLLGERRIINALPTIIGRNVVSAPDF